MTSIPSPACGAAPDTTDQRIQHADPSAEQSVGAGLENGDRTAVEWSQVRSESSVTVHERHESPAQSRRVSAVRTCVGCRKREPAAELLRIVASGPGTGTGARDFVIVPDARRRLPGRGAWLHPFSSCLRSAVRRRAIGRALRVSGHLDISALERHLENRHEHS